MRVLAVTSGKGGVGKTTLALNIARQLSLNGLRTLIIDFDIHNKGTTGLFLGKVSNTTPSVISVVGESRHFDQSVARDVADAATLVPLDERGELLLLPAAKPREMIKWDDFVDDNDTIVAFFRLFIDQVAANNGIEVVVIDCYGGIDSLTVAGAGVADDTIIINEPDIITFSGTLLLYNYLAEIYKNSSRKPRIHFVINRVTSRHSFRYLNQEYQKHLSRLSISKSILAYFPYDEIIMETFGDYPFFTELLPKSLVTKKIHVLIRDLWQEKKFSGLAKMSERKRRRIYERTTESAFADPKRILRTAVLAPIWLLIPTTLLTLLASGVGGSLPYQTIRFAYYLAIVIIVAIVFTVGFFEPCQIVRWLSRGASYRRRKSLLRGGRNRTYLYIVSSARYLQVAVPIVFMLLVVLIAAVIYDETRPWVPFRNVSIWPGEITGLKPGGNYSRVKMRSGATIPRGTNLQGANFSQAQLVSVQLPGVDLAEANLSRSDLSFANLNGATMSNADLRDSFLRRASLFDTNLEKAMLVHANVSAAILVRANLQGANLSYSSFNESKLTEANLTGAVLESTKLIKADLAGAQLRQANLQGANLTGSNLSGADLRETDLRGAILVESNLNNADLDGALLQGTNLQGAKGISDEFLFHAESFGAVLDEFQRESAKRWGRASRASQRTNQVRISSRVAKRHQLDERISRQRSLVKKSRPETESHLHNTYDMVELLIFRGRPEDLAEAHELLEQISRTQKQSQMEWGVYLLLKLLVTIVEGEDDVLVGRAWCDWIERHRLAIWSWETWNSFFPYYRYSTLQNEKLRATQLTALGEMNPGDLRRRYFGQPTSAQVASVGGRTCPDRAARVLARAYVRSNPTFQGDIVAHIAQNRLYFVEDGAAIRCAEALGKRLVYTGVKAYDPTAYERAMGVGPAEHAGAVADSINSRPADLVAMGQELLWLAKVLPSAARGDWGPYETTGTPMRQQIRQVLPIYQQLMSMDPAMAQIVQGMMQQFEPVAEQQILMLARMLD